MNIRLAATVALCTLASAALVGQQTAPRPGVPPQDKPVVTFRSTIDAVQLDVMVTDADGNAVSGLTVDDFELVEDGKPQPITTFEAIDIPIESRKSVAQPFAEPDIQSNDGPPGRVYLFAIDDLDGCAALRARRFLRQFVDEHLGPDDIAGVALVGRGLATDGQDFTRNRRLLLNAVGKISGEGALCSAPRGPRDARTAGRSQQMASLRALIESIARIPGRHKAMLFFTHGPEIDMLDIVDYNGGVLGLAGEDAHGAMMAATRSNLRIYPIDPTGLTPDAIPVETQNSMRALGTATGGFALVNSNSFTETFERIVRDNSVYYMLGFNSGYEKDNGRYVRVQVRVKRPGLTVHAREGYVAPTRDERRAKDRAEQPSSAVEAGLASPLTTSGLNMRVSAVPYKGAGKSSTVALTVDIDAASLDLVVKDGVYSGQFDFRYLATDAKQKVYPEVRHTATVRIESTTGAPVTSLAGVRVRVVTSLELPEGRYQLRVAAGTPVRAGNVVYDLEVPDFRDGPLAMSGIALLSPSEASVLVLQSSQTRGAGKPAVCRGGPCVTTLASVGNSPLATSATGGTTPLLQGRLPGPPTTVREFAPGDQVTLVTEVYDNHRPNRKDAPHTLSLTTALRGADDRTIALTSDERASTSASQPPGVHRFTVRLPLKDVPPGAYALEVTARSSTNEPGEVSQRIPIRVR